MSPEDDRGGSAALGTWRSRTGGTAAHLLVQRLVAEFAAQSDDSRVAYPQEQVMSHVAMFTPYRAFSFTSEVRVSARDLWVMSRLEVVSATL
jgi:hypothetical protein